MKGKWKKIISLMTLSLILVALCVGYIIYRNYRDNTLYITAPEGPCINLFGCTPSEFFDKEMKFYQETGDFRKNASLDKNGNLHLVLSPKQLKAWRNSKWLTAFEELQNHPYIQLSDDLTCVTVSVPNSVESLPQPELEELERTLNFVFTKIEMIRLLDGVAPEDIATQYIEIDTLTNEIVTSFEMSYSAYIDYEK